MKDLIDLFTEIRIGKLTVATKFVDCDILNFNPQKKTRICLSLTRHSMRKFVDVRTTLASDPRFDRLVVQRCEKGASLL